MPAKESFDIDGLMVFRGDLTAVDPDGNTVASVTTPDKYVPSLKEPLSDEQIGRYTKTTAYWREHSTYVPLKGDVIIYSDGGSITEGGVTVYVPKMKVGDGVTTVGNLPFSDSDNQGGGTEEVFVCTFTESNNTITCNKTFAQINTAWQNNKVVVAKKRYEYYYLTYLESSVGIEYACFVSEISGYFIKEVWTLDGGSTWDYSEILVQEHLIGSGTGQNIKTINGNSVLGSGDLTIGGVTIYSGSTAPSSATGVDGDIYIQEV